nr:uncharacterized protein LOC110006139 [Labrus bergylta]
MADNTPRSSDGNSRSKLRPERYSLSRVMELLGLIGRDNSEVEDLSDIDDPVGDAEYQPPRQEPSTSEEDNSGCEGPIPQPSQPIRGRKRLRDENEGYRSDRDRSRTPRRRSQTQQDEADVSNNVPEEITPGPSHQEQSKKGCGMRWRASPLTPNQAQFEHEEETVQDRAGWTPLDYIEQYIDKDLMKMIADCSDATSLARSGDPLINTSTDEIYHFFGACILISCILYPAIRMYWSKALRFTEMFT